MTARHPRHLLGGYATDSLGEAERAELLRAALDDQELFDALVEDEGLRELLQDPAARQEVLAALEQPTGWARVRAWFERPATLLDLAAIGGLAIAAVVGLALVTLRPLSDLSTAARPTGATLSPAHIASLLGLPEKQVVPAGIEIQGRADAPVAPGEMLPVRISLRAPARVVLLLAPASGPPSQAWPALGQAPALVPAPEGGGPAIVSATVEAPQASGALRLRLVVAPGHPRSRLSLSRGARGRGLPPHDRGPSLPGEAAMSEKTPENLAKLQAQLGRVILGKPEAIDQVLVALLAGHHLLLEDKPGVGKTTLAKALARCFSGTFRRVQFTPDLLPSDILGASILQPARRHLQLQGRARSSATCCSPTRSTARRPAPSRRCSRR